MGERLSGGGTSGRRHAHPDAVSGHPYTDGDAGLEALIAAAVRQDVIDAEAEQRAVAAFRTARDTGAHRARTRRRDDWRPRERRARLSMRATLSVLAAGLTLGGVAYAAMGPGASPDGDDGTGGSRPGTSAPDHAQQPSTSAPSATESSAASAASSASSASGGPSHPESAQDAEAHCSAYEQVKAQGRVLDAPAWQRLVAAAGGEDEVEAYCASVTATAVPSAGPGTSLPSAGADRATARPDRTPADSSGGTGADDGAGDAAGNGTGNDGTPAPTATRGGTGSRP
ncbi:hypothetical protein JS756_09685 [Streptomyces actuosus]|uniref:Uncharacterized protein n=1 Tax=Streptomyces actuosus TaxID=1885 RepID=A0ABS2VMP4_STRAS|nr:hypothetical protein [Streptomyces actuosus]MBN0044378.1 hypothetical protein [Streptomyces actuosus]